MDRQRLDTVAAGGFPRRWASNMRRRAFTTATAARNGFRPPDPAPPRRSGVALTLSGGVQEVSAVAVFGEAINNDGILDADIQLEAPTPRAEADDGRNCLLSRVWWQCLRWFRRAMTGSTMALTCPFGSLVPRFSADPLVSSASSAEPAELSCLRDCSSSCRSWARSHQPPMKNKALKAKRKSKKSTSASAGVDQPQRRRH